VNSEGGRGGRGDRSGLMSSARTRFDPRKGVGLFETLLLLLQVLLFNQLSKSSEGCHQFTCCTFVETPDSVRGVKNRNSNQRSTWLVMRVSASRQQLTICTFVQTRLRVDFIFDLSHHDFTIFLSAPYSMACGCIGHE